MAIIEHLTLSNFRLFKDYSIAPHKVVNVLCGANASGKTSILEAIWYLSSGKSFCTKNLDNLVHRPFSAEHSEYSAKESSIQAIKNLNIQALIRLENDQESMPAADYGISRHMGKNIFTIANSVQKNALKHTKALATLLITPENLLMVGGAPNLRRKRLNWGCFYLFPLYHQVHVNYERALKQRNKALKQNFRSEEVCRWDAVLAREARYISECREEYLKLLEPLFKFALSSTVHSLEIEKITLTYFNSVNSSSASEISEQLWLETYAKNLSQDRRDRCTNYGPHRGDMRIKLNGKDIESQLSRGQWKILSSVLLISQAMLLKQELNVEAIILIDDFSSELDVTHRHNFIRYIEKTVGGQTFISTVAKDLLADYDNQDNIKFFELTNPRIGS